MIESVDVHVPESRDEEFSARIHDLCGLRPLQVCRLSDVSDAVGDDLDCHTALRRRGGRVNDGHVREHNLCARSLQRRPGRSQTKSPQDEKQRDAAFHEVAVSRSNRSPGLGTPSLPEHGSRNAPVSGKSGERCDVLESLADSEINEFRLRRVGAGGKFVGPFRRRERNPVNVTESPELAWTIGNIRAVSRLA